MALLLVGPTLQSPALRAGCRRGRRRTQFASDKLLAGALFLLFAAPAFPQELIGFHPDRVEAQREMEQRADDWIVADELLEWNRLMTPRPHHAGAPQTEANARWMVERFREWGFEAEIETFDVLFPTPRLRSLTLLEPTRFEASLVEEPAAGDGTAEIAVAEGLPPFNAFSADGDVTGELVYVNRGVPEDYEVLERLGIDVRGKIVIVRYGGSWRGIKPKVAYERGAIGCLIFNDPGDDGYSQGAGYPDGSFKHSTAVQRGSVLDLPLRPGDPLTPMRGAVDGEPRLSREDADTLMRIPVLPIAWRDAQPLLEALGGETAPGAWRGGLPITYRIGPGPARVRLQLEFDWSLAPAHNVIARMPGTERPDQWILRGNHHDAWVIGARDPISGLVGLMAEAKALGRLAREGHPPRRTVVYAAWDAEEPGLLGSTEWAEHHAEALREHAAVYINSDSNSRGFLRAGGSHALETLVNQVVGDVEDPQTGVSVGERLLAFRRVNGNRTEYERLQSSGRLRIAALGSGSDYSPFLQHLGVSSLNVGYGGEGSGGEYHTAFDTFDFFRRFVDPGAVYGAVLARTGLRLTLRLANADVLPFEFGTTAATAGRYINEVADLAEEERRKIERENELLDSAALRLAADPTKPFVEPEADPPAPHLNFAPLRNAHDRLARAAKAADRALAEAVRSGDVATQVALDELVTKSERRLTRSEGLPRRPWFRHHLYAPGMYTGYGVKTLPGVREAIEQRDWDEAQWQIDITAGVLAAYAEQLEKMAGLLSP
ncbi:MAG: M28 family peptidase [Holophagales bacterium]|nr:M28 family peptidase [Holophagales bacterium]